MSEPVKPAALTDEQIHEEAERRGLAGDTRGVTECFEALGRSDMFWEHQQPSAEAVFRARQRICDDITARRAKETSDTDITPLTGDAAQLDRERAAHQVTALELSAARDRIADLERRLDGMTAVASQANRDAAAAPARERIATALDRAARAITGQSAEQLNATLEIEVREYPHTFDPSGGHL